MSEKYDKAEREYIESKIKYRKAKDLYEFTKAKHRQIIKAKMVSEGVKPTLQDLDDALLIEQNNISTELGTNYVFMVKSQAEKEVKYQEKKREERAYWDNKGIGG